ncbi:hypothetical protein FGG08_000249 [Glutinoglossum americanum]|uniref:Pentatricopeptide repeat-containing protein n=1 Tax=Glutinoglossum americanum TaxID=1670608 RepID=A0A9P8IDG4_9PEZI|nr:hypothetical protein FGG08_000249 [Glutinoglossum americanum]
MLLQLLLKFQKKVICSIPRTTFSEILQLLDPKYFFDTPKCGKYGLDSVVVDIVPVRRVFSKFVKGVPQLVEMRRLDGRPFGLKEYTSLLNCARACRDPRTATALWRDMKIDHVVPNTTCYNYYMAVKLSPYLSPASKATSGKPRKHKASNPGVKDLVLRLFDDMVLNGLGEGDSRTFCLVMTAMGEEGDIAGVKSVLNKVWGVNVDALLSNEEEPLHLVKKYCEGSPLFPDSFLLYTIANAFGSNNDIPSALRIIDFVSRQYSVTISSEVWTRLLKWTCIWSARQYPPRFYRYRRVGESTSRLSPNSVQSLWDTMAAEPYNVKPVMAMYNEFIRSLVLRKSLGQAQEMMEEGLTLLNLSIERYMAEKRRYFLARSLWARATTSKSYLRPLQRRMDLARVDNIYAAFSVRKWVRLLIRHKSFGRGLEWERVSMPDIIQRWRKYLPKEVHYLTTGGIVSFSPGARSVAATAVARISRAGQ